MRTAEEEATAIQRHNEEHKNDMIKLELFKLELGDNITLVDITDKVKLDEDEYLLKFDEKKLGFITKLNKNGSVPVKFKDWNKIRIPSKTKAYTGTYKTREVFKFKEKPRTGWKYHDYRIGESQQWVKVSHPLGFVVEIYLRNFMELVKLGKLTTGGEIVGELKWEKHKLVK